MEYQPLISNLKRQVTNASKVLAAVCLLGAGHAAHATLMIGNLPVGSGAALGTNDVFSTQWNAAQFTTGGSHYFLENIIINASNNGDGAGGLDLDIYDATGTGGTAGSVLASLTTTDVVGGAFADISFSSGTTFYFESNTTYWLVAKGTLDGSVGTNNTRVRTNRNPYIGATDVLSASVDRTQYFCADGTGGCFDDPITWLTSPGSPNGDNEMGFAVFGTAVPEPMSIALLSLGLLGIRLSRRQRR